jgi:uncharacterized protein YbaR (Trm112 family)
MVLPEGLLAILACPVDKGDLLYLADEDLLYNPRLRRAYRVEGGIPVLRAERAESIPEPEHERLMGRGGDDGAQGAETTSPRLSTSALRESRR